MITIKIWMMIEIGCSYDLIDSCRKYGCQALYSLKRVHKSNRTEIQILQWLLHEIHLKNSCSIDKIATIHLNYSIRDISIKLYSTQNDINVSVDKRLLCYILVIYLISCRCSLLIRIISI